MLKTLNIYKTLKSTIYDMKKSYDDFLNTIYNTSNCEISKGKHKLYAIQPYIKWGNNRNIITNQFLMLEELVSLIDTLPNKSTVKKSLYGLENMNPNIIFGKGQLEEIKDNLNDIDAIAIGISCLSAKQKVNLQKYFKLPVIDKYQIILEIFKTFANSKEARLQIALANIPYLRIHSNDISINMELENIFESGQLNGIMMTQRPWSEKLELLNFYENKLRKELQQIAHKTDLAVSNRQTKYPIIAVVGYTNSGKTSLIKALAEQKSKLNPMNRLFATLDTTLHEGILPYGERVLFLDTIGFITDIPKQLINSFKSTMNRVNFADLIIHVRDCSHPDFIRQNITVLDMLEKLEVNSKLMENMIVLDNKIDLNPSAHVSQNNVIPTSCYPPKYIGIQDVLSAIHQKIMIKNENIQIKFKICIASYSDLYKLLRRCNASIIRADPNETNEYEMEVIVNSKTKNIIDKNFSDYIKYIA